jgi:hypothetical protein
MLFMNILEFSSLVDCLLLKGVMVFWKVYLLSMDFFFAVSIGKDVFLYK